MSKNPVVHFEMPYKDAQRVSNFYQQAFGWKMNDSGADMGNYILAHTAEMDENNMVKTPGTINGGFYSLTMAPDSTQPSVVVSVNDIQAAMQNIKDAGGEVISQPQEIPGIGMWAVFYDTEGNRVSILQSKR